MLGLASNRSEGIHYGLSKSHSGRNCLKQAGNIAMQIGPSLIEGNSIKVNDLFETEKSNFVAANVFLYGKMQDISYYNVDLLWGQKHYQKLRFVLVSFNGINSTNLSEWEVV